MITTLDSNYINSKLYRFSLAGTSTDAKPVRTYQRRDIQNGSLFLEMDTGKLYFYDADVAARIEFGGDV